MSLKWELLHIKVPRDVEKTPKSMEQIFSAVHSISASPIRFWGKWFKGAVSSWISFEITGRAGKINFYVRVPEGNRDLLESAVYSQYPEAEINLVPEPEDYVNQLPSVLPNDDFDIWGTEFILAREDGYPIRTYPYFEEREEERRVDPIAIITEVISKLEPSESIWLQLLIRSVGGSGGKDAKWVKEAKTLVAKLMGEKEKVVPVFGWLEKVIEELGYYVRNIIVGAFEPPTWPDGEEKKEKKEEKNQLTPGTKKIIEAIEDKISKLGFEGALRFVYIDKRDRFTRSNIAGVMGAIKQFNTLNLNALKPNPKSTTMGGKFLGEIITRIRKRRLYSFARHRDFPEKFSVFNTEELATLYHFPIGLVKSPSLKKTTPIKGAPPADLPLI